MCTASINRHGQQAASEQLEGGEGLSETSTIVGSEPWYRRTGQKHRSWHQTQTAAHSGAYITFARSCVAGYPPLLFLLVACAQLRYSASPCSLLKWRLPLKAGLIRAANSWYVVYPCLNGISLTIKLSQACPLLVACSLCALKTDNNLRHLSFVGASCTPLRWPDVPPL